MNYKWTLDPEHKDCLDCCTRRFGYHAFVIKSPLTNKWLWCIIESSLTVQTGIRQSQTEAMLAVVQWLDNLPPQRNLWSRFLSYIFKPADESDDWRRSINHVNKKPPTGKPPLHLKKS